MPVRYEGKINSLTEGQTDVRNQMYFPELVHRILLVSVGTFPDRTSAGIYTHLRPWPYICWTTLNKTRQRPINEYVPSVVDNGGSFGDGHPVVDIIFHHTVWNCKTKHLSSTKKKDKSNLPPEGKVGCHLSKLIREKHPEVMKIHRPR